MTKARDLGDFISDGTIAETVTADGLNLGDNEKIQLGASQDLQLYHDGSNSLIQDTGTGILQITSDGSQIKLSGNGSTSASFYINAESQLFCAGALKLATKSNGIDVTGTIAVSDSFNATSGTFTVQSNGTDILNVTSTLMSPQTDGAISLGSASNAFNNLHLDGTATISGITYPTSDGTDGQVLTTNGSGAVSFSDPAGGGSADFVASGAIASGAVVVLNSNGTVSVVTGVDDGVGTTSAWGPSGSSYMEHISATFDSANNKVIVAYRDQLNSGYPTAVVGTVSGSTISFGTPVVANSAGCYYVSVVFVGGSHNKIVVSFRDLSASSYGRSTVGQVSGTSITFGSVTTFETSNTNHIVGTFDSNSSKLVLAYSDSGDSNKGKVAIGTINGTFNSISFGTPVTFNEGENYSTNSITFDSNTNKIVIVYNDNNNTRTASVVGTVSGTSISFGSAVEVDSTQSDGMSLCFDSTNNKVVVAYKAGTGDAGGPGRARVGTVSGTTISWGATATFYSTAIGIWGNALTYDASQQKVLVIYNDRANPKKGRASVGTVSGTSITFSSSVVAQDKQVYWPFAVYDSNATKSVLGWAYTPSNNNYATAAGVFTYASTDAGNYIGVADGAISNSATGKITINGGINEAQSSLTIGTTYFVGNTGGLQTTNNGRKIGRAISATKLLVNSNMSGDEMNAYLGGLV